MCRRKAGGGRAVWAFLLPELLGTAVFVLVPFGDVLRRSCLTAVGSGFVGLSNYRAVIGNKAFRLAAANTARFMAVCLPLLLLSSLGVAVMFQRVSGLGRGGRGRRITDAASGKKGRASEREIESRKGKGSDVETGSRRGRASDIETGSRRGRASEREIESRKGKGSDMGWLKSGFMLPMAVPAASVVVFFQMLFDEKGWLNMLAEKLGFPGTDWLNCGSAFWVLVACYIWKNLGYDMILWLTGIVSIGREQYEAARVQGAGELACFWYITLPQLKETAYVTALLSFVNAFRVFREAYLLSGDYPHESIYMLQHLFNNWFVSLDIQKLTAAASLLVLAMGAALVLGGAAVRALSGSRRNRGAKGESI